MLKDYVIDYDDMIKAGQIQGDVNEIPVDKVDRKFAIIIKTAKAKIGKFDITDVEAVKKSIHAIENNDDLDETIKKSAQYFVKQAADFYDIQVPWEVEKAPREIRIEEIEKDAETQEDKYVLKIANDTFFLNTVTDIEQAEEQLLVKQAKLDPLSVINGARMLIKAAAYTGYKLHEDTAAYANAKLGSRIPEEIGLRKRAKSENERYLDGLNILSRIYNQQHGTPVQKVAEFMRIVQDMDKIADFKPAYHNTSYANLLKDKPGGNSLNVDNLFKLADANGDEELASILE